jgi:predicted ATPase/DNA-binding SARP family transcriptional activator
MMIRLFGPFEVALRGEAPPRFRSRTEERLLALLTLRHGRDVERDWLAGLLWPGTEASVALSNLRRSLHYLRRTLGREAPRLRSPTPRTLCLDLTGAEADVVAFDAAIARADIASLLQAVALYRGPLLEGSAEEWVFQERRMREQTYLAALETLAADARGNGDPATAEVFLRRAVAADPLRETAQRALMQTLAGAGNYAAAIHTYRELRDLLHRELHAEPDPATRALFEALRTEARRRAGGGRRGRGREGDRERGRGGGREGRDTDDTGVDEEAQGGSLAPSGPRSLALPEALPEDTVTFLFADIEGGARLWEERADVMRLVVVRHDRFLRGAIASHRGRVLRNTGDTYCAAFETAAEALAAALAAQCSLYQLEPSAVGGVSGLARAVRIVLHAGAAEFRAGDYSGAALHRAERLLAVARGSQILLSATAQALVQDDLPPDVSLRDLGTHRLRDLQRPERVFQLLHPDLPGEFPPLASLNTRPNNLPEQITRFIGRERELAEIHRLLKPVAGHESRVTRQEHSVGGPATRDPRLITITGTGGSGKTRLALQLAAELEEGYADGVRFVELAALTDPALVPQALAATLSVREERDAPLTRALVAHLRAKQILVVLDNCEHLLAACATLAEALLRACPEVVILATSREALNIPGETIYRLPSLSLPEEASGVRRQVSAGDGSDVASRTDALRLTPDASCLLQSEAVRLFLDRATAAAPSFRLTPENAAVVAQVCRQLDGIPLAIELAAARLRVLSVEQIAARLDDRFRLLTGGSRTALPRQQTLRATLDWSYDLLPEPERALLRRLAVFAGGWTLEAAEAVCGDEGVRRWALGLRTDDRHPTTEAQQLSNAQGLMPNAQRLTPDEVLDLLTSLVDRSLVGIEERAGGTRYGLLETTREYARDRLREAGEADERRARHAQFFLELAESAEPELRGAAQAEWLQCLETEHDNLRAALEWCLEAGSMDERTGDRGEEPAANHSKIQTPRSKIELGLRLGGALGPFWWIRGYLSEGRERLRALLAQSGYEIGCPEPGGEFKVSPLGIGRWASGAGEEGSSPTPSTQHPPRIRRAQAKALNAAGVLADDQSDYAAARALFEESLALSRECGDLPGSALALHNLGGQAARGRDYPAARAFHEESLVIWRGMEDRWWTASALSGLGRVALMEGNFATARTHIESGLEIQRQLGDRRAMARSLTALGTIAARLSDDEAAFALYQESLGLARELGARVAMEEPLRLLGKLARERGDHEAALAFQEERLAIAREVGNAAGVAAALCDLARLAGERGENR